MSSSDLIQIALLELPSAFTNTSDTDIENMLCYNLTKRVVPDDLTYAADSSVKVYRDNDISGSNLIDQTIILNNENLINNELFGMKVNYVARNGILDNISADIGSISNNIYLDALSNSFFDSNLKIDISFNNNEQFTDDISNVNVGMWGVTMDRNEDTRYINTFAAVNSLYNRTDGISPFYIQEASTNTIALGYNSSKWFSLDPSSTGDKRLISNDISYNYTLSSNGITSSVLNNDSSDFNNFNMYKLVQNRPTITASVPTLNENFSNLPIQYNVNGTTSDISSGSFDFSGAFLNTSGVGSGFQLQLDISAGGGYNVNSNNLFTIDDNQLTRNASNPYIQLSNLQNLAHIVDISNGNIILRSDYSSNNASYIDISNSMVETLDTISNGLITLLVDSSSNRVYYPDNDGSNSSNHGNSNAIITDKIIVTYPGEASTSISNSLLSEPFVDCNIEVLITSTNFNDRSTFINQDNRNIDYDISSTSILTVVYPTSNYNNNTKPSNVTFTSTLNDVSDIRIISVHNESKLSEDTLLLDSNNNNVDGTAATVTMTGLDLSSSAFSEFKIQLDTKKISDLATDLNISNNNWSLLNENDYLIGNTNKVGIINDSYLFMTSNVTDTSSIDISYEFVITNPDCGNVSSIKRAVKVSFNDIVDNNFNDDNISFNPTKTVTYINQEDITFIDVSSINFTIDIGATITDAGNTFDTSRYTIIKHILIKSYYARFDPKIQFYENVIFQTPLIVERITYYSIFEYGIEKPFLLKTFKINGGEFNNFNLANVKSGFLDIAAITQNPNLAGINLFNINQYTSQIKDIIRNLPTVTYNTSITYSKNACSIFKASIWGKYINDNNFTKLEPSIYIDPFFKQTGTINNFLPGPSTESSDLIIQFLATTRVTDNRYNINITNQPGLNQSFKVKLYSYDVNSGGSILSDYSPYYNYFDEEYMTMVPAYVNVIDVNNATDRSVQLRIYKDESLTKLLAVIDSSSTLINSFNIITIPKPYFKVDYTVGTTLTSRLIPSSNNKITIDNGIDYYFKNITNSQIGQKEHFRLVTDSFSVQFTNGSYSYTATDKLINNQWLSSQYVRSIRFNRVRGYNYVNGGKDTIVIDRTTYPTSGIFRLQLPSGLYATQSIGNIYKGKQVTLNSVVNNGTTYSLGLNLNFYQSILGINDLKSYNITLSVAEYSVSVINNPYNTSILTTVYNGNIIANQNNLMSIYFANVKPASIKAYNDISLRITYNVDDAIVYNNSALSNKYVGNPILSSNWNNFQSYNHNNLIINGANIISSFKIQRSNLLNVFYNSYTSYFVISPPVVDVYGATDISGIFNLSSISNLQSKYITSFHINHTLNNKYEYIPTLNGISNYNLFKFSFRESIQKPYYSYITVNTYKKRFRIEGNYVTVKLYMNGIGYNGASNDPAILDNDNNNFIETLINNQIMTNLQGNTHVTTNYSNFTNNVSYNQFLISLSTYSTTQNIVFSLGNPFTSPKLDSSLKYYLRLPVNKGSIVSFYQSTLEYVSGSYFINIDRFETGAITDYSSLLLFDPSHNVDYNALVNENTINEVLFPIFKRYTRRIYFNSGDILNNNGLVNPIDTIIDTVSYDDVTSSGWTVDSTFRLQYLGITISAITTFGRANLRKIFDYDYSRFLSSKLLYFYLPDIIRFKNTLGNTIYRVTYNGNVHAPRVITTGISLFNNAYTNQQITGINGSGDIQTIFVRNSLVNDNY